MMKMMAQTGNVKSNSSKNTKEVWRYKWWPALLFFLCVFIYANTINHKYAYDDKTNIYSNTVVQKGIAGLPEIVSKGSLYGWDKSNFLQYRPVLLITFAIEKSVFGQNPTSGHLINILLYGILCVFIFRFLLDVLSAYPSYVSALITLLFIVHPLHTEVVANIKSRDEILSMLFGILSLILFLKFSRLKKSKHLLSSLLCYFLSFHSKESGYLFLAIFPVVMYFFTPLNLKTIVKNTLPYLLVASIGIAIRLLVLDSLFFGENLSIHENSLIAAKTTAELFATRFTIVLHALKLLFFPFSLSCD
jgi:preprotein translocase subunit SecG